MSASIGPSSLDGCEVQVQWADRSAYPNAVWTVLWADAHTVGLRMVDLAGLVGDVVVAPWWAITYIRVL